MVPDKIMGNTAKTKQKKKLIKKKRFHLICFVQKNVRPVNMECQPCLMSVTSANNFSQGIVK